MSDSGGVELWTGHITTASLAFGHEGALTLTNESCEVEISVGVSLFLMMHGHKLCGGCQCIPLPSSSSAL